MSYRKAAAVLPSALLEEIQTYIDGEYLYIPRLTENRKAWGTTTATREELVHRDREIFLDHRAGMSTATIAENYFVSQKSVQRIIRCQRKNHHA